VVFIVGAVVAAALPAWAGSADIAIEAHVTAVTGSSVYLDRGRADHVAENDRVLFHRAGLGTVEGTIRSVSKNSARAELAPGTPPITVGARAEIFIPEERLKPEAPPPPPLVEPPPAATADSVPAPSAQAVTPPPPTAPAHPPWTHPPESWTDELPLLAPAFSQKPEERQRKLEGRVYLQGNGTWDQLNDGRRYFLGAVGTDMRLENPFGQGGELELDAQFFHRVASVPGATDDDESSALLRQFSYSFGGTPEQPSRFEFGRFLQNEFSELGVLDGVEWSRRSDSGSRFGASVGAMPEPTAEMDTGDDTQAAVFYRYAADPDERFLLGAAYQNTWHKGEQDRNLFVGTLDYNPPGKISLRSSVWIDYYGSEDSIKTSTFELTEAQIQASWRMTVRSGLSAFLSHVRYPEMQRIEFASLTPEQILDDHVERVGLSGWHEISDVVRVNARVDAWQDQDDGGNNAEIGAGFRDLLYDHGEVSVAFLQTQGSFSSGPGFRVSANRAFGDRYANLTYSFMDFEQKDFTGEQSTLAQHAIFGSFDLPLGSRWDLSLFGEKRFGDEQDSYSLGFLVQMQL
jgi:hypothetical protein